MIGLAHDASAAAPPAAAILARNSRRDIPSNGPLRIGHNPFRPRYLLVVVADGKCATINNDAPCSVSCRGFSIVIEGERRRFDNRTGYAGDDGTCEDRTMIFIVVKFETKPEWTD